MSRNDGNAVHVVACNRDTSWLVVNAFFRVPRLLGYLEFVEYLEKTNCYRVISGLYGITFLEIASRAQTQRLECVLPSAQWTNGLDVTTSPVTVHTLTPTILEGITFLEIASRAQTQRLECRLPSGLMGSTSRLHPSARLHRRYQDRT
jgi:hypothetical protein